MQEELLEIVDKNGKSLGIAPRSSIHGDPSLLHKVVHVLVFDSSGRLLLQKRSMSKDVAPGKWDTSVGGHVAPGEDTPVAAHREMEEELGVDGGEITFLYSYIYSNTHESELVSTHSCIHDGPFRFNADEIDEIRFWRLEEIIENIGTGIFSGHFEAELATYMAFSTRT
ncbi:MAG: NUDIX domain-containing protein [Nitrospirae bacterium]|nr:NUDIX domain-containing protein [Nitrospirota bacterium]